MQSTVPAVRIRSCCVHGGHRRTLPARLARPGDPRDAGARPTGRACGNNVAREAIRACVCVLVAVALVAAGCRYTSDLRLPDAPGRLVAGALVRRHPAHHAPRASRTASRSRSPRWRRPCPRRSSRSRTSASSTTTASTPAGVRAGAHPRRRRPGNLDQGGSTITQQYVRAVMLGPEKDLERKLREAVMAVQLEHRYSKRTILERYLNTIYFGNGAYGVQAAAHRYFGRDAARPRPRPVARCSPGVIRAPETYNPFVAPGAGARPAQRGARPARPPPPGAAGGGRRRARAQPLGLAPPPTDGRYPAPYFVEQVTKLILGNPAFGVTRDQRRRLLLEGGLRIHTTLDPKLQALAEQSAARVISQPATDPAAALVVDRPDDRAGQGVRRRLGLLGHRRRGPRSTSRTSTATRPARAAARPGARSSRSCSLPRSTPGSRSPGPTTRRPRSRSRSPAASRRGSSTTTTAPAAAG